MELANESIYVRGEEIGRHYYLLLSALMDARKWQQ